MKATKLGVEMWDEAALESALKRAGKAGKSTGSKQTVAGEYPAWVLASPWKQPPAKKVPAKKVPAKKAPRRSVPRPSVVAQPVAEVRAQTLSADLDSVQLATLLGDKRVGVRMAAAIRGLQLGLIDEAQARKVLSSSKSGADDVAAWWEQSRNTRVLELLLSLDFSVPLARTLKVIGELDRSTIAAILAAGDSHCALACIREVDLDAGLLDLLAVLPSCSYTYTPTPAVDDYIPGVGWHRESDYSRGWGRSTWFPQIVVALHRKSRAATLDGLVKARSKYVRAALAARPHKPALPALAGDRDPLVRATVAAVPEAPKELINVLLLDKDESVRSIAALHPRASKEGRAAAALLGVAPPDTARETAEKLLRYRLGSPEVAP